MASLGEMPSDGDLREYRLPRPAQKPRGDFVSAGEMPGDGDGHRCLPPRPSQKSRGTPWRHWARCHVSATAESGGPPCPVQKPRGDPRCCGGDAGRRRWRKVLATALRAEVALDFLASLGEMPSDSYGREYRLPRPAQKPRGEFVVAEEIPGDSDGKMWWPPRPVQKSRVTSWCLWTRCQVTATSEGGGPPRPAQKRRGDFVVAKEMPGDGDGHRYWLPRPAEKLRGTSLGHWTRCQATATAKSIGRRAPRRSRAGTSSSPRRCRETATTIGVSRLAPRRIRVVPLGVAGRDAERGQWPRVYAAAPRAEAARGLRRRRGDAGRWQRPKVLGRLTPRRSPAGLLGVAG